jgi:hypothetical protein
VEKEQKEKKTEKRTTDVRAYGRDGEKKELI